MKNKLVYLTPRIELSKYNEIVYRIDVIWFNYLINLGYNPILLDHKNFKIDSKYKPHAVFMVGGGDISECKNNEINRLRDKLDLKLYKYLKLNKVKVISICRSSQLLLTKIYKFKIFKNNNHVRCNHIIMNNKLKLNVNSYHNYSLIGDLSKFQEYFIHKDGSIEIGVDSIRNNLILMFHPERKNINQKKINNKILKFINL
tara:strand:- start:34709 stop:35311 length:603 start_codon:yes stop_codon:yes gene_type:complete